jgi:hypothetical protein
MRAQQLTFHRNRHNFRFLFAFVFKKQLPVQYPTLTLVSIQFVLPIVFHLPPVVIHYAKSVDSNPSVLSALSRFVGGSGRRAPRSHQPRTS